MQNITNQAFRHDTIEVDIHTLIQRLRTSNIQTGKGFYLSYFPSRGQVMTMSIQVNNACDTLYGDIILKPYLALFLETIWSFLFQLFVTELAIPLLSPCLQPVMSPLLRPISELWKKAGFRPPYWSSEYENWKLSKNKASTDVNANANVLEIGLSMTMNPAHGKDNTIQARNSTETPSVSDTSSLERHIDKIASQSKSAVIFITCQLILLYVQLVFAAVHTNTTLSGWTQYTNLYGLLTNSILVTVFVSLTSAFLKEKFNEELRPTRPDCDHPVLDHILKNLEHHYKQSLLTLSTVALLVALPVLFTHIIPGIVIYSFVFLGALVVAALVAVPLLSFVHTIALECDNLPCRAYFEYVVVNIFLRFALVLTIQTLFNYMVLFYRYDPISGVEYIDIVATEYRLRTETTCYYQQSFNSVEKGMVLFGWL